MEMKRLSLVLCLLSVIWLSLTAHAQSVLDQASEAYRSHDYQTAIVLYEEAVRAGNESGAVYFNLGNAYYEAGYMGLALLNYRRAARLIPRDTELAVNISRIYAARTPVASDETDWLVRIASVTGSLTFFELSLSTFFIWSLFFALAAVGIVRRSSSSLNFRILLSSAGVLLLSILFLYGSRYYVDTYRPLAVATITSAPVYSGPGEDYQWLYALQEAAEFRILDQRGDWIRFVLSDGRQGWLETGSFERVSTQQD